MRRLYYVFMRCLALAIVATWLAGCGAVKKDPPAAEDARGDGAACADPTSVETCGPTCVQCEAPSDRATPTCDGTACDFECNDGAPQCTDASCSRVVWAFSSGMVDGITARMPTTLPLAVRNHAGNQALAIDVTSLTEISFRIPVCISGTVDVATRMFKVTVFFEGGNTTGEQYFIQASSPQPATGQFLGNRGIQAGQYVTFSAPMSASTASGAVTDVTIQAGSYGAAFAGTIWFDDIRIE